MYTPSHLIMTAALRKAVGADRVPRGAALIGSVAPDLPLLVLSLAAPLYFIYRQGWTAREAAQRMFGHLYFNDPWWIAAHNLLSSPTSCLIGLVVCGLLARRGGKRARWWAWFLAACLLHSFVDVLTHHDDGPLLWFPFDWRARFFSPVSYWDPRYYARQFAAFEIGFDIVMLAYVFWPDRKRRAEGVR